MNENDHRSIIEDLLEVLLAELGLAYDELGQLVQDFVKLYVVFVLGQVFIVAQDVAEFSFAV